MKVNFTKRFFTLSTFILACLLVSTTVFAQIPNDDVCNAIALALDGIPELFDNNGATSQPGEENIVPPYSPNCLPGTWCDNSGPGGIPGSTVSLWYTFDAPAAGGVLIDACGSAFDTQLALYEVSDCNDFSTFNLIWATDDEVGCGVTPADNLASTIPMSCLNPGQTYYVLIDGWMAADSTGMFTGIGAIGVTTTPAAPPVAVDSIASIDPTCQGGADGTATATATGVDPLTFDWSNGDTGPIATGLAAGTYTVSVTDFCGTTSSMTVTINDGPPPSQISLANLPGSLVHPSGCGSDTIGGQVFVGVTSGTAPFTYAWSNGATGPFLNNLTNGVYTVTVSDACGNPPAIQTFVIGASAGADPADCSAGFAQLGGDGTAAGGQVSSITYSTDQSNTGNVSCGVNGPNGARFIAQNSWWRAFDLDTDFGVSGAVNLAGLEVRLNTQAGPGFNGLQPVEFAFHTSTDIDIANGTLTELVRMSLQVPDMTGDQYFFIPMPVTVQATDVLVAEVTHPGPSEDEHQFFLGANQTATTYETHLSSTDCGLAAPTPVSAIGFTNQTVMNVFINEGNGLAYAWDDPNGALSDPNSPNPVTSTTGTYTVTITDVACGTQVVDSVFVDCGVVNNIDLEDAGYSIFPNPSNGVFNIVNDGQSARVFVEIFDLQGQQLQAGWMNLGTSDSRTIDLSQVAKGMYLAKITDGARTYTHKLVVQ